MDSSLGRDARLSFITTSQEWIWPPVRSLELINLRRCIPNSLLPNDRRWDVVCWKDALWGCILHLLCLEFHRPPSKQG